MNSWNGLDFIVFLILSANIVLGMARGATREIISMICLSAALICTIKFTVPLANFLNSSPILIDFVNNSMTRNFMISIGAGPLTVEAVKQIMYSISLLICFVGVFSLCEAGLNVAGVAEMYSFPYAYFDRKLGGALGFTRGYIISLLFLSILAMHIFKGTSNSFISNSFFVNSFQVQIQKFDELVSSQRPENYNQLYQNQPKYNPDMINNTEKY